MRIRRLCLLFLTLAVCAGTSSAQTGAPKITSPKEFFGFNIGDDYQVANYTQLEGYWKKLATESDRAKLVEIGRTAEGRPHLMMIISSPANHKNLAHYQEISRRLALAEGVNEEQAHELAREGKAVIYIEGGLHASETVGSQQELEFVYEMLSRNDAETTRFLNDTIILAVLANPDGLELVADWYMRRQDPKTRTLNGLPRLYQKYIGHDNNRDSYISNQPETVNINRVLFREWHPLIMYDHHQAGPPGTVIFIPPFRDPFNYNLDPLVPLEIEQIGATMHARLVSEGKGGSGMRSASNYSTWYNGAFRTNVYFHNMIGILSEIIGNPTPDNIPLVLDKQLPSGDWPLPVTPQLWHYRQSIEYEMTNNRAMLDYSSRNRENLLFYRWRMGMNAIEKGSQDSWTITPKRIAAAKASPAGGLDPYKTILHDPKFRDPRGYIIPANQADYPTAVKFVNALLTNGVDVMKASRAFEVAGKTYPAGSFVVKTAQAFRPQVMDMFEPQDHPNDFRYPGGPPIAPYDTTGWTLAYQMNLEFDRVLDAFDGPFTKIDGLATPAPASISGPSAPAGYLVSHRVNDSFILTNRLLKAGTDVFWVSRQLSADGEDLGTGALWIPASASAKRVLETGAKELGVAVHAAAAAPSGPAMKLKPVRIGLYDQYGGLMPSGWARWLLEKFEFPYQVVYPQTVDAGNLNEHFDVLLFADGSFRRNVGGRGSNSSAAEAPADIPEEFQEWTGRLTEAKSIPQIKKFVDAGGSVITIGSSTSMASLLGVPVSDYLTEKGPDGVDRHLPQEKFYIPGSLLTVNVDNTRPLGYGLPERLDINFDSSPAFRLAPEGLQHTSAVAWFSGAKLLHSGWAWGQEYLDGATAIAEANVGEGKVTLFGPEVIFRGQPHGTFKLLFNSLYTGSAKAAAIPGAK